MTRYFDISNDIRVAVNYFKDTRQIWISQFPSDATEDQLSIIAEIICHKYSCKLLNHFITQEHTSNQTQNPKILVINVKPSDSKQDILDVDRKLKSKLKEARKKARLTQEETALRLEMSVTAYRDMEVGYTRIINKKFQKACELLDIEI